MLTLVGKKIGRIISEPYSCNYTISMSFSKQNEVYSTKKLNFKTSSP